MSSVGFSVVGLVLAVMIFAPSLLFAAFPPSSPLPSPTTGVVVMLLERAGQIGCLAALTMSGDGWSAPLVAAAVAMAVCIVGYDMVWARYVVGGRDPSLLYDSVGPLPVPLAVLPVLAFSFAAIAARAPLLGVASVVLAAGHWPASWSVRRQLRVGLSSNVIAPDGNR